MKGLFFLLIISCCLAISPQDIKTVHLVSMNHLDIGFDGIDPTIGYAVNVINKYFDEYFPLAINVSTQLREKGGIERLIYTTHPWLVSLYLDCNTINFPFVGGINETIHCPSASQLQAFEETIKIGDITWHAFPFNAELEVYDKSLLESSLRIAKRLDKSFKLKEKATMSQRDVPGVTRAAVPILKKAGVKAISVGVNGATSPPAVPSVFRWVDSESKSEIYAMWNPGGYGWLDSGNVVMVDGLDSALVVAVRNDNGGPPPLDEVLGYYQTLQKQFPNANITASDFDSFVHKLDTVKDSLPIIDLEIGDTWIHGIMTDPLKTAKWRAIMRARKQCIESKACDANHPDMINFDFLLTKCGEHTWGLDIKTFLSDWENWSNELFEGVRNNTNYQRCYYSWQEQRYFIDNAIESLNQDSPLIPMIQAELDEISPEYPNLTDFSAVGTGKTWNIGNWKFEFDSENGGLNSLIDRVGNQWSGPNNPIGRYAYTTFSQGDYDDFLDEYAYCPTCWWLPYDFGKVNLSVANPQHLVMSATLQQVYFDNKETFWTMLTLPNDVVNEYGGSSEIWTKFRFSTKQDRIEITHLMWNKTATRLPEASWMMFRPALYTNSSWYLQKLGRLVEPKVVLNGSHHLHSVEGSVMLFDGISILRLESSDAGLVSTGGLNPFPTPLSSSNNENDDVVIGMDFNLHNNIWGTNYPMWYPFQQEDQNLKFRFTLQF
eukprot:TRINITY_DN1838_c0_g1_i1.p1 TRINITY_DN1838_c0_g1~~TRINITY_DN1838_c0_g1_i1.p1  ORF type:complete len:717 (-),score=180.87 TRINITY_DN1838_c0_g1_i1:73-2223(-)